MLVSRRETLAGPALLLPSTAVAAFPPSDARVAALLARMTLDEKIAQLGCLWLPKLLALGVIDASGHFDPAAADRALPHGIGHVAHMSDLTGPMSPTSPPKPIAELAALNNALQAWARRTRLGIPVLVQEEATHGVYGSYGTTFPSAMALGCTWDPALVRQTFAVAAREARARGIGVVLAPVLDVLRDPRWGRADETFGEDPYLNGAMGVAAVRGLRGMRRRSARITSPRRSSISPGTDRRRASRTAARSISANARCATSTFARSRARSAKAARCA